MGYDRKPHDLPVASTFQISAHGAYGIVFVDGAARALGTVPQTEPATGNQVPNSAGGFVFPVSLMDRLRRFCILGAEGGTYYATQRQLKIENAQAVARLVESGQVAEAVAELVAISEGGRAPKQDATIFALAALARLGKTPEDRKLALDALGRVCRIPTHLFAFVANCKVITPGSCGWGRGMRTAISDWYNKKRPEALAMALTKYQQREGWSHRDVLRLAHCKPSDRAHQLLFKYAAKDGWATIRDEAADASEWADESGEDLGRIVAFLQAVEEAKTATEERLVALIRTHRLVREHVPTPMLNSAAVWEALLHEMPMTALVRNLNKLTQVGVLAPGSPAVDRVVARLCDEGQLRTARIHPLSLLVALRTYASGKGELGKLQWVPNDEIVAALDRAFYASFRCVIPTGKRFVLALDVSGSMAFTAIGGMGGLTPRDAAAAMAMVTLRTEPMCRVMAFQDRFVPLDLRPTDTLEQATKKTSGLPFGATDCSLPMLWAQQSGVEADVFVVYTDSETYAGKVHPSVALRQYRAATAIDAKLIVVGMVSNGFTIADPTDAGMLDVVGFDTAAPEIMAGFVSGQI